jgi:hypothetical protein
MILKIRKNILTKEKVIGIALIVIILILLLETFVIDVKLKNQIIFLKTMIKTNNILI